MHFALTVSGSSWHPPSPVDACPAHPLFLPCPSRCRVGSKLKIQNPIPLPLSTLVLCPLLPLPASTLCLCPTTPPLASMLCALLCSLLPCLVAPSASASYCALLFHPSLFVPCHCAPLLCLPFYLAFVSPVFSASMPTCAICTFVLLAGLISLHGLLVFVI